MNGNGEPATVLVVADQEGRIVGAVMASGVAGDAPRVAIEPLEGQVVRRVPLPEGITGDRLLTPETALAALAGYALRVEGERGTLIRQTA